MATSKDHQRDNLPEVNFQLLFESISGLYLILLPDFTIIAVSDDYARATMTTRDQITGKNLFEVFPDNPDDPNATGELNLRASLNYVLKHKTSHTMAVQKYDIRTTEGTFEKRFWSPLNKPVLQATGEILYIIHRVEDVTKFVEAKEREEDQINANEELRLLANSQTLEIFKRSQELQKINEQLVTEIAERKAAEEKARETQLLLQATIESYKDILFFSVDKQYNYLNFNSTFKSATFFSYGTEVVIGNNLLEGITNEADRKKILENCDRAFNGERHITIEQFGDINRLYYETRYNPIISDTNQIIGVTVLSANVTSRILAEEEIKALNKELEAFTYSAAHDLRSPLRIIDGYSNILLEDHYWNLDDKERNLLQTINANVRHMGSLIDGLLNFSRLGKTSLNRKLVDLDEILDSVLREQLALVSNDRIELKIKKLEPANCDANLMEHVFSNLISNAVKYSSKKEKSIIEIGSDLKDDGVVYFVKDNGSGFDMKYANKLFGVFQRLHGIEDFEGTGVGLAIVDRIISRHGGKIWAESEVNKGATFYFSL